jgi:hypothetical protein
LSAKRLWQKFEPAAAFQFAVFTAFRCRITCIRMVEKPSGERQKSMQKHLESEAMEALRDTLRQVSVIKVKEISVDQRDHRSDRTIFGHIEIYGHAHLLACKVVNNCQPECLKRAVEDLQGLKRKFGVVVMPVLIAPVVSDEAQTVCRESGTGFLDLAGNARLYLDEVFIVKRCLPHRKELPSQAEPVPTSETAHFAQVA